MKHSSLFLSLAVIAAAIISSCSMESSMTTTSYAIYVKNSTSGYTGYFVLDDSTQVFVTNGLDSDISDGQRTYIAWKYKSEQVTANPMYVELTSYDYLSQAKTFMTAKPDTLGTAGADLYFENGSAYLWKCGGVLNAPAMINIGFYYATNGYASDHTVYLTYGENPIDSEDYYHLHFSHDPGSETNPLSSSTSLCAFTLPKEAYTGDVKGLVLEFDGLTDEGSTKYRFTYSNARTEKL